MASSAKIFSSEILDGMIKASVSQVPTYGAFIAEAWGSYRNAGWKIELEKKIESLERQLKNINSACNGRPPAEMPNNDAADEMIDKIKKAYLGNGFDELQAVRILLSAVQGGAFLDFRNLPNDTRLLVIGYLCGYVCNLMDRSTVTGCAYLNKSDHDKAIRLICDELTHINTDDGNEVAFAQIANGLARLLSHSGNSHLAASAAMVGIEIAVRRELPRISTGHAESSSFPICSSLHDLAAYLAGAGLKDAATHMSRISCRMAEGMEWWGLSPGSHKYTFDHAWHLVGSDKITDAITTFERYLHDTEMFLTG